jgi:hypothetical protein
MGDVRPNDRKIAILERGMEPTPSVESHPTPAVSLSWRPAARRAEPRKNASLCRSCCHKVTARDYGDYDTAKTRRRRGRRLPLAGRTTSGKRELSCGVAGDAISIMTCRSCPAPLKRVHNGRTPPSRPRISGRAPDASLCRSCCHKVTARDYGDYDTAQTRRRRGP